MAKTLWNAGDRKALLARFHSLRPDSRPVWGEMSVSQMLRHCTVPIYAAMGELKVTPKRTFFRFWLMQKLIIYVLPWPKSVPTAPEFESKGPAQTLQPHATFGVLSGADWGALMHRHLDHHLRQFGV